MPSTVTVDIVGGPNNGSSLLWTGGTTVSAHRGGLAGIVKETMSLHDPRITTIHGSSIDDFDFPRILAHARNARSDLAATRTHDQRRRQPKP